MKNGYLLFKTSEVYVTSKFGFRKLNGKTEFHNGTDYGSNGLKINCLSPFNGICVKLGVDGFGARFCYIEFDNGYTGLFYHLDCFNVYYGKRVKKGDVVGVTGSTGLSSGVHLHFSLIKNDGKQLNYNNAEYVDFEKFEIKGDDEMISKKFNVLYNGKIIEFDGFEKGDRMIIYVKDLTKIGFNVSYDSEKDLPILNRKV